MPSNCQDAIASSHKPLDSLAPSSLLSERPPSPSTPPLSTSSPPTLIHSKSRTIPPSMLPSKSSRPPIPLPDARHHLLPPALPSSVPQFPAASAASPSLLLHRWRLVEWQPSAVVALAGSIDGSAVAAARESGDIEIWRVAAGSVGWAMEQRIAGSADVAISSLAWCRTAGSSRGQLLSAGLSGSITEWNLNTQQPTAVSDSYGGPVWGMAVEPEAAEEEAGEGRGSQEEEEEEEEEGESESESEEEGGKGTRVKSMRRHERKEVQRVAVACDDGCVRLFAMPGLTYVRSFPKTAARLLSVVWDASASRIFSGGADGCIRCWDVESGRELFRMTAGMAAGGSTAPCVWSLLALRDGTVVSGDSSGSVQFWDGRHGVHVSSHCRQQGDVLCLAAAPDHGTVFSGGVDGKVVQFQLIPAKPSSASHSSPPLPPSWVYVGGRQSHSRDVRALTVATMPAAAENEVSALPPSRKHRKAWRADDRRKWQQGGVAMLLSAGNDAMLLTYPAAAFLSFHPHSCCPTPQAPPMALASQAEARLGWRLLLVQQATHVDVWGVRGEGGRRSVGEEAVGNGEMRGDAEESRVSSEEEEEEEEEDEEEEEGEDGGVKEDKGDGVRKALKVRENGVVNGVLGKRRGGVRGQEGGRGQVRRRVEEEGGIRGGSLGASSTSSSSSSAWEAPKLIARIKAGPNHHLRCSAISQDGLHVALSDSQRFRLYELHGPAAGRGGNGEQQVMRGEWRVEKRAVGEEASSGGWPSVASCLQFSADSCHLFVGNQEGGIDILNVASSSPHLVAKLPRSRPFFHATTSQTSELGSDGTVPLVRSMAVSSDGKWLAAVDLKGEVTVYDVKRRRHHWDVPATSSSEGIATGLAFVPSASQLLLSFSSQQLLLLDVAAKQQSMWSSRNAAAMAERLLTLPGGMSCLSLGALGGGQLATAAMAKGFMLIDLSKDMEQESGFKGRRMSSKFQRRGMPSNDSSGGALRVMEGSTNVLFVAQLDEHSILVVEKPWGDALKHLPPPLHRHTFGS